MSDLDRILKAYNALPENERKLVDALAAADSKDMPWVPNPGPQTMAYFSAADELFYGGAAGGGKMLALDTPVATRDGWRLMGDLSPGDVVFDETGAQANVVAISAIETPKSYQLTFDDGEKIVACADHLWRTFTAKDLADVTRRDPEWKARRRASRPSRAAGNKSEAFVASIAARNAARAAETNALPLPSGSARSTQEIVDTLLTASGRRNHAVQVAGPIYCSHADLPVPPYVLGAWLGDGTHYSGGFTSADEQVWREIEAEGFTVTHAKNSEYTHYIRDLVPALRDLGVLRNKHVPSIYLRASREQRLALLQGLMDTDGHAALDGGCEFDNTNRVLVAAVYELAVSLGIKASITEGVARLRGRAIGPKWRVKFATDKPVFRLKRKLDRLRPGRRTQLFRYIVDAIEVDPVPMRCIQVDSPSRLYLAGHSMIPTHNSDLLLGLAINEHEVSQIFRLQHNDRVSLVRRLGEIITGKKMAPPGYRGDQHVWSGHTNKRDRIIDFGALSTPDAWVHYMGRPADLKGWDELPQFRRDGYKTVNQWLRSTTPGQRCRIVGAGNPPLEPEQFWVVEEFAPWLDPRHHNPAVDGELRYFATIEGEEVEVDADWRGVMVVGDREVEVKPVSRTFIRALLQDNEDLANTDYGSRLANSPLAEHLLLGKFDASIKDAPMQLIPTEWILAAQERWRKRQNQERGPMTCVGIDPNQGGNDEFGIAPLYGTFFDEVILGKGVEFKSPRKGAAFIIENITGDPQLNVDCTGGYGAGIVEHLDDAYACKALMMSAGSAKRSKCKMRYEFENKRAEYMWGLREALDPEYGDDIALPPDRRVVAELAAPGYMIRGKRILIEPKEKIIARLGRSPTILDTTAYAWAESDPADRAGRPSSRRRKARTTRSVTVQTSYANARAKYNR